MKQESNTVSRRGFLAGSLCLGAGLGAGSLLQSCTSAPKSASEVQEINFALDWTPNTNHIGLYVAQSQGLYEQAGLKVNILPAPEDGAEALVASGGAHFGISFQDTLASLLDNNQDMPLCVVSSILQHNTSGIISLAENNITSPAKMAGHTYATWEIPIEQDIVKTCVIDDGGNWDEVRLVPSTVTDELSALESKQVDCIWVYEAWAKVKCDLAGLKTNYFSFASINPVFDYYTPLIVGNLNFCSEDAELAKKFLEATAQGYRFASEHPNKAAEILLEAVPELESNLVHASLEMLAPNFIDDKGKFGTISKERWKAFYNWLYDQHLVSHLPASLGLWDKI